MSHLVKVQTKLRDQAAIGLACQRLGLAAPLQGTARFYSGEATGLLVQLRGWTYPLAIDTTTGAVQYDTFEGRWGEQAKLDQFMQMYAVEKCRQEARAKGYAL